MKKIIVTQLSEEETTKRGIRSWPVWTKEVSRFDWYYDSMEECLILEGDILVETPEGNFTIKAGDFVTFHKGLKCVWNVNKPVRKHYNFK
ncbi:MAG TPA: cupin domain-containing protein [Bacteroidales bacterium]|nr:cupin domain-containing protein [Bacteroidales bacterium]